MSNQPEHTMRFDVHVFIHGAQDDAIVAMLQKIVDGVGVLVASAKLAEEQDAAAGRMAGELNTEAGALKGALGTDSPAAAG